LADSYHVVPDDDPLRATVILSLAAPLQGTTFLRSRSTGGVKSTVDAVACTEPPSAVVQHHAERWEAPAGCTQLSWSIRFKAVGDASYELSKQESLYHPKEWWFLNESGSLLRYEGQHKASVCGGTGLHQTCTSLPRLNQPPMFLLFGRSDHVYTWKSWAVTVYMDHDAEHFGLGGLIKEFGRALDSLAEMLGSVRQDDDGIRKNLQFAWLGIDSEHQSIGGAAGNNAFIANFMIENNAVSELERTRLLIVSGHEYVHMLGLNAGADWVTESLASYFGYKAVASRPFSAQVLEQMTYPDQPDAPLHARGAALWRDLDISLHNATHGSQSLENFLPMLMQPFSSPTELPGDFVQSVADIIGHSKFDHLVGAYL
jgi:hypothetical protein